MALEQRVARVLVVDDEESVRRFAEGALRHGRYEVALASGGPEALRYQPGMLELTVIFFREPDRKGFDWPR